MNSVNKPFDITWPDLHRDAKALSWRVKELGPWQGIIAVTRGGMIPAAIIASELEIRKVDTVSVASYDHQTQSAGKIIKPCQIIDQGKGWLVVDDLVDTGETFKLLRPILPSAHFATIYAKPKGKPMVDTYLTEVSQDTWINFPWEVQPT